MRVVQGACSDTERKVISILKGDLNNNSVSFPLTYTAMKLFCVNVEHYLRPEMFTSYTVLLSSLE